jgi:hypothetical protein
METIFVDFERKYTQNTIYGHISNAMFSNITAGAYSCHFSLNLTGLALKTEQLQKGGGAIIMF